ncbi:UDP-N-acetylglucosamine 2-epimerase (non-hydrolyzing) [Microbacterium aoyamense]|uniref:UDP-N-acetylglucosamine 2-epimerase (non-hydrolyzing) n=1 Tax=Microbacterium aoyamense TaxID=344166 RepID=A0ABN2PS92_9MICO|nr:UDP-N-acetylglucosamine 2-epimerase (non-hydrolyzing) [Microbacterium aoyamense]
MEQNRNTSALRALFVVGTRPEAIKMLPLIVAARDHEGFEPIVVSTGQHAAMVAEVLAIGGIVPDVTFALPEGPRTLNDLFSFVVTQVQTYVTETFGSMDAEGYPVATFVHGDTSSAAAAALASFHLKLPVVHVEAGLRTNDVNSPFPEEFNRQLISRVAALHLAPTSRAKANLVREGIDFDRILITGNTAIDALRIAAARVAPFEHPALADLETADGPRVVVVTAHRRENWGEPLARIADSVAILASGHPDDRFVVALHPNPAVADVLVKRLSGHRNVSLVPAMGYASFARLLGRATLAITDSGGIQEEAPSLGVPVICVRETTERQEGVAAGTVELVGTDVQRIVHAASVLLDDPDELARRSARVNPYGDGFASARIIEALDNIVSGTRAPESYGPGFDRTAVLAAAGVADPLQRSWVDSVDSAFASVA